jgi:peptidoglycan/LPS O-acetylase OafA/YrhL
VSVEDIQGECEAVTDVSSELPGRSALHTGSIPARGRHASGPATVTPGSGLPVQATRPARASFGYRPELDGIRALAVFAVFASHVGWGRMVGGWIGVGIFFVLSGYLITSILMVEWQRTGAIALRSFYLKRLLRLYPALLVMLVGCALFAPVFGNGGTAKGYLFSAAATGLYFQDFIAGITGSAHGAFLHTWSLAVEEQFYMFWPPALILILRKRASVLVWALAGTAVSWILLLFTTRGRAGTVPATYALPHTRAGELLLGCALAAWLARDPSALNLVAV